MGWDIAILVGVALCQGATGYWAFHMSAQDRRARWGFGIVTGVGIALIIWSGMRTSVSSSHIENGIGQLQQAGSKEQGGLAAVQTKLDTQSRQLNAVQQENGNLSTQNGQLLIQNAQLDSDLQKIAGAAKVSAKPGQSSEITTSQIIQYLASIDQRLHHVEYPPRDDHSLYDGARAAAQVAMTTQQATNGYFTIQALTSDGPFDFSKTYFLQKYAVKCDVAQETGAVIFGAESHHEYQNVNCQIVGVAPQ